MKVPISFSPSGIIYPKPGGAAYDDCTASIQQLEDNINF
jgi:hypothetical protein